MHDIFWKNRGLLYLLLAFFAGAVLSGFFFYRQGSGTIGKLDNRYAEENRRAAEIIGRITEELERERELTGRLQSNNNRAREITDGLAVTTGQNVRNLQEAVVLIGEVRKKLQVLAEFYADSDTGNSGP